MPYIPQDRRRALEEGIAMGIASKIALDSKRDGELNYVITRLLSLLYQRNYKDMNAALGVLEAVKQEFYRCVVAPYEQKKREENGDVY